MGPAVFSLSLLTMFDKLIVKGKRSPLPDTVALGLRSLLRLAICLSPFLSTVQGTLWRIRLFLLDPLRDFLLVTRIIKGSSCIALAPFMSLESSCSARITYLQRLLCQPACREQSFTFHHFVKEIQLSSVPWSYCRAACKRGSKHQSLECLAMSCIEMVPWQGFMNTL